MHDEVAPKARFNPFSGMNYPTTGKGAIDKASVPAAPAFDTSAQKEKRTDTMVLTRSRALKKHERDNLARVAMSTNTIDSHDRAAELLRHDDEVSRKERELCARMAVRKLMSLHFHAKRTSLLEDTVAKEEARTVTNRFLEERQKIKEQNASSSILQGAMPVPDAQGFVSKITSYPSQLADTVKKADARQTRLLAKIDKSSRLKGVFVATPENTAELLKQSPAEVEEVGWQQRSGVRSIEEILAEQNEQTYSHHDDSISTPAVEAVAAAAVDDDEWADAHESTFTSANEQLRSSSEDEEESGSRVVEQIRSTPKIPKGSQAKQQSRRKK